MKIIALLLIIFVAFVSSAEENSPIKDKTFVEKIKDKAEFVFTGENPIFGDNKKMIGFQFASSSGIDNNSSAYNILLSYSVKTSLLMNGRTTFEVGTILGHTSKANGNIDQVIAGMMHEFVFNFDYFYITAGIGGYIRTTNGYKNTNDPIGSNFTFGEKLSIGKKFNNFNVELFLRHFSNGSITAKNTGYTLIGLEAAYSF